MRTFKMSNIVRGVKFYMLAFSLLSPLMSLAYPSDFKDQVNLVFNVLTGKSCEHLYDVANAIYRNQANEYNADITPLTSYEKVKKYAKK
jgi:hypothetical protein